MLAFEYLQEATLSHQQPVQEEERTRLLHRRRREAEVVPGIRKGSGAVVDPDTVLLRVEDPQPVRVAMHDVLLLPLLQRPVLLLLPRLRQ